MYVSNVAYFARRRRFYWLASTPKKKIALPALDAGTGALGRLFEMEMKLS
jgi:hypothetical protein